MRNPLAREILLGIWKIHILYHAGKEGVYGQWMLEELAHHGHRLSPGTLYPILARMVERGWLRASPAAGHQARVYRLTPAGRVVLDELRDAVEELHHEIARPPTARKRARGGKAHGHTRPPSARPAGHPHEKDKR